MIFAEPLALLGLLVLPLLYWCRRRMLASNAFVYSWVRPWKDNLRSRGSALMSSLIEFMRIAVLALFVLALARPQMQSSPQKILHEGIDMVLAIDTSGSMRAMDFAVNKQAVDRLAAVKSVIEQLLNERANDRFGIVVFGSEAFTQAPLTLDHEVLQQFLEQIRIGMAGDATAIGDAIAMAASRLKNVTGKSKIVILLTDGENTAGKIDPLLATQAAAQLGIKIYTIGIGREGRVPIPVTTPFGERLTYQEMKIDEKLMTQIAEATGGKYFRAYDTDNLQKIYQEIDKLEKSKLEKHERPNTTEVFAFFAWPGLLLLAFELLLRLTKWRRAP